jgi:hypothetical protein
MTTPPAQRPPGDVPPAEPAQSSTVPHQVLYVFADFQEMVRVDCWCDHEGDHVDAYPFHQEIIRPLIDTIVRRVRRRPRRGQNP